METSAEIDALLVRFSPNRMIQAPDSDQLGLLYVGTYAVQHGYRVRVIDQSNMGPSLITEAVNVGNPSVIGFYVDHENIQATLSLIDYLKEQDPKLLCICGGPQASIIGWDEKILRTSACDIVVRDEGESAFTEILDWYLKGQDIPEAIRGITYWKAISQMRVTGPFVDDKNHEVCRTPDRPLLHDLDSLPVPDRSLNWSRHNGRGVEYLITGRGCPGRCAFCYEGRNEAIYRSRSMASVLSEVESLLRDRQPAYINVLDDTFILNPKRVIEFCEGMKILRRKYYDVRWFCEARANIVAAHPEIIRSAVEAGLIRVQIGVESGDQHVLDAYRKGITLNEIREAIRICAEADVLSIIGNFIIGGAFENPETVQESIGFAEELLEIGLGRMDISTTMYTPYPGTAMYDDAEKFGLSVLDPDCETGPGDNYAFVQTEAFSKWQLLHVRQEFNEAIGRQMLRLLPRVSDELLARHVEAHNRYHLRTNWYEVVTHLCNYRFYFNPPAQSDHTHLSAIPIDELENYKPLRTVFIAASHDGKLVLSLEYKILELGELATFVFEHCYGKTRVGRIIDRAWQLYFPSLTRAEVKKVVINVLRDLENEKLLVFTRF